MVQDFYSDINITYPNKHITYVTEDGKVFNSTDEYDAWFYSEDYISWRRKNINPHM